MPLYTIEGIEYLGNLLRCPNCFAWRKVLHWTNDGWLCRSCAALWRRYEKRLEREKAAKAKAKGSLHVRG